MRLTLNFLIVLCVLTLNATLSVARASESDVITFADIDIEDAVRAALHQPTGDLTRARVATVRELAFDNQRIVSLAGLEACTGLERFSLRRNYLKRKYVLCANCSFMDGPSHPSVDIAPLAGLTNLKDLAISGCNLDKIDALAGLTQLERLDLSSNNITSFAPVSSMQRLRYLNLRSADGFGVNTTIPSLASLDEAEISPYLPEELSALRGCPKLRKLTVWGSFEADADTSGIGELQSLEVLTIADSDLMSLAGFERLTQLRILDVSSNPIQDLSPLANLTALEELNLERTAATDLGPLRGCTGLRRLLVPTLEARWEEGMTALPELRLTGLQALGGMTSLEEFDLAYRAPGESLASVAACTQLKVAKLMEASTADLAALATLPRLEVISCSAAKDTDFAALASAPVLLNVSAGVWDGQDLSGFAEVDQISHLLLDVYRADLDLTPLADMANLQMAGFCWSRGELDLAPLAQSPLLDKLRLRCDDPAGLLTGLDLCDQVTWVELINWGGTRLAWVAGMERLQSLRFDPGHVLDLADLRDCPALSTLRVKATLVRHPESLQTLPSLTSFELDKSGLEAPLPALTTARGTPIIVVSTETEVLKAKRIDELLHPVVGWDYAYPGSQARPEGSPQIADLPVTIPDERLRRELSHLLDVAPDSLTQRDLARVEVLDLTWNGQLTDLTGLEHCANLRKLDLTYTAGVRSLAPLAGLPALEELTYDQARIEDLTPLTECPRLRKLGIGWDAVFAEASPTTYSASMFLRMPALRELAITGLDAGQAAILSQLVDLESLTLYAADGTVDLQHLASLTNLRSLAIDACDITDLSPLGSLTRLKHLEVTSGRDPHNQTAPALQGLHALRDLSELQSLDLWNIGSPDLRYLQGLPRLRLLKIRDNALLGTAGIGHHPQLRTVQLTCPNLRSLADFQALPQLRSLWLSEVPQLTELPSVFELPALRRLHAADSAIADYTPLIGCPSLADVHLQGARGVDLRPFGHLTELRRLNLNALGMAGTDGAAAVRITDITPLAGLTRLESLELAAADIADVGSLAGLSRLRSLRLSSTRLSDLSPLAGLSELSALYVAGCQITDLGPLVEGVCLRSAMAIDLQENPLSLETYKRDLPLLEARVQQLEF